MAEDSFKKFKKRYEEGKVPTLAMPPLPAGPGPGIGRMVGGAIMTAGRKKLMDTLAKSREKGAKARNTPAGGGGGRRGTLSDKLQSTRSRERTPREKEKFGPLAKREENLPAKQSRAIVKREEKLPAKQAKDSRALTVARENKGNLATTGTRTFGDKGAGKGVGMSTNMKRMLAAGAVGGAAYGLYKGADKPKAEKREAPRDDRASSNAAAKTDRESRAAAFKAKQQGMKTPGSPTNPSSGTRKVAAKAAKPEKKLTNFERMKMRGYEKEGLGGRSMTSERAKSRVKEERGFKFKDLFKKR